jgi:hypothetical protein
MKFLAILVFSILSFQSFAQKETNRLLQLERQWLDAYETNNPTTMNRMVAEGFQITFPDGGQQTKADLLKMTQAKAGKPSGVKFVTHNTKVTFYGKNTAVLRGTLFTRWQEQSGSQKEEQQLYTDTYVKINGRWQVVASHLTTVKPE